MEENEIPKKMTDDGENNINNVPVQNIKGKSEFFENAEVGGKDCKYYEILYEEKRLAKIIFCSEKELKIKGEEYYNVIFKPRKYDEIILIFDFNNLAEKLDVTKLEEIVYKFLEHIKENQDKTNLSLIIQNCLIEDKDYEPLFKNIDTLKLNKLVISDELYSFSPYIKQLFANVRADELTLKKFKFNSKAQLSEFSDFILSSGCTKLTLDDFFIELIIKKNENDDEYNDLDIYFSFIDKFIVINNVLTDIKSLTLRDCPLFAIIGDIFSKDNMNSNVKRCIDIDQNSLLNPGIITKFKIVDGKCDICFDLDSYKLKLEEIIGEEKIKKYDYTNYLFYIFNILVADLSKNSKDYEINDIEESGVNNIYLDSLHKLIFKNFDMTKLEYITGDDVSYIKEEDWVLNEEENKKKLKFENFERLLKKSYSNKKKIPEVKELIFDNCSNYFIEWVLFILKGGNTVHREEYDFDLVKIKKCGNNYVDISRILKWKINKLILFDTPLIVGTSFPEKSKKHLDSIRDSLGSVDYLTIKINSLDCYGREYNLNIMKTYEILIELIECENFNKNLIFEMNALSSIMTYLAYKTYVKDQKKYNDPNEEEDGLDDIKENQPQGQDFQTIFEEDVKYLPKYIFLGSKKFRDYLCSESFKLDLNLTEPITIKNTTIKKSYENYENQNYLLYKIQQKKNKDNKKPETKIYTTNKELRKMDFGSDGFYIERDYKYFFYENGLKTIKLENVGFSNFRDNNIEGKYNREFETINNLIGKNLFGESIKKYEKMTYPNYIMDMKTFNGIFCVNYGYENVAEFFKHYLYKTSKEDEKESMFSDIKYIKSTINRFENNIKKLTIIINNIKEQKEFYCLVVLLNFLINPLNNDLKSSKSIPDRKLLDKKLCNYFMMEKNENDTKVYSEIDYYNISEEEEEMAKNKKIRLGNFFVDVDIRFNHFEEYI